MKRIRVSLMALVLTAGVAGAVTTSAHPGLNKKFVNFNWQSTDASGNVITGGMYDASKSQSQAQLDFVCSGSTVPCAVTVTRQDGPKTSTPTYIYQNN
jgi:hypothetical protein